MATITRFFVQTFRVPSRWVYAFLSLCIVMCISDLSWAQSVEPPEDKTENKLDYAGYRFKPYEANNAAYQATQGDQNSAEVNFSFMYLLTSPDKDLLHCQVCLEAFLSYTGKFDFYMGSRPSGPVINRISNPAAHFRLHGEKLSGLGLTWLDMGIEHKSNGQVVSANQIDPISKQYTAAVKHNAGDYQYFDSISRGTNYLSFEGSKDGSIGGKDASYRLKLFALHRGEESDVYWGKYAGQKVRIADFERTRLAVGGKFGDAGSRPDLQNAYGLEWTVGDKGLATDSANIWVTYPVLILGLELPLTLRAHFGPMNELSNYTESRRSVGIGLDFYH